MSVPSTQRPIPLRRRPDLQTTNLVCQGITWWVIKDPIALQYHRFRDDQYQVLQLLDGRRSLEDVRDQLRHDCPTVRYTLRDLQQLVTDMHQKELVRSNRIGQGPVLRHEARRARWSKIKQTLMNPLSIQVPGIDPQKLLDFLLPWVGWIFHPAAMIVSALWVATALAWVGIHFQEFHSRLPEFNQFFGWPNLIWLWITMSGAKILHEFGHGLSCRYYGAECHEMGVMLLVFSPCLYCDATDSWMLTNKWKRIAIGAAGMYFEAILSAFAVFLWWNTSEGLLNHLCLNVFFVSTITTVIFNLNPLMRYDGYYMLSDFLEIPNLRPKADQLVREKFSWWCLGIESRPDPFVPDAGHFGFIVFAVAAWCYRWVILFGITYFLCTVLKPYGLQSVGMTAAVFSLGGMAVNLGRTLYKILSEPREEPLSMRKITVSLAVVLLVLGAVMLIPLPFFVQAPFTIEPERVEHVYVTVPGRLVKTNVKPGDRVKRGDVLAVLENAEKADRRQEVATQIASQQKDLIAQRALREAGQRALSEARLHSLEKEAKEIDEQLAQLTLVAPADGVVVAAERKPEPKLDVEHSQLATWYGTPLDPANVGCWLDAQTPLLSIAPNDRFEAILLVDQQHRDSVHLEQDVSLKLEHLPNLTYRGKIDEIARREEQYAPSGLAVKQGGDVPTVTDPQGKERLTTPAYQAIVPIDPRVLDEGVADAVLRPGLRGHARIMSPRSAGSWLWRALKQTLNFKL